MAHVTRRLFLLSSAALSVGCAIRDPEAGASGVLEVWAWNQANAIRQVTVRRGIDVRGLFHWTAVDNYEWLHGYDVQFGIIDRDRNIRPSAQVLQREAAA